MPCLQEITFAEHAESEVIPASDSVEVGYADEDSGGHCGSGGNHVDCEEDAEVATALWCEQPRVVQAKGRQRGEQGRVCLTCSSFKLFQFHKSTKWDARRLVSIQPCSFLCYTQYDEHGTVTMGRYQSSRNIVVCPFV